LLRGRIHGGKRERGQVFYTNKPGAFQLKAVKKPHT